MKRIKIKRPHGKNGTIKCARCGEIFSRGENAWKGVTTSTNYYCEPCYDKITIEA